MSDRMWGSDRDERGMRDRSSSELDERLTRIAALGEPIRRALYRYVISRREPVGRDQAAEAVGVPRHTAKFHLDRLETDGLLETEYSRPPGRNGPGAGRPAKRYRRADGEIAVSLPERRYDIVGRVLARAVSVATESGAPVGDSVREAAVAEGHLLGAAAKAQCGDDPRPDAAAEAVISTLADYGYEPHDAGETIELVNCPFHTLAEEHSSLVCGMNLDLISGLLEQCPTSGLCARLDPAPGRCCVLLEGHAAS
jgi:predicted ArsR family transcriptional regulator